MTPPPSSHHNADARDRPPWQARLRPVRRTATAALPCPLSDCRPACRPSQPRAMIPVAIVTGFLGSGKTTLISPILRDPAFARAAVIVNEFGEIGLDHELIASSDEALIALTTGCLCCAVRSDLVATLLHLHRRREAARNAFDR